MTNAMTNEIGAILEYTPGPSPRQVALAGNAVSRRALIKAVRSAIFIRGGLRALELLRLDDGDRGAAVYARSWDAEAPTDSKLAEDLVETLMVEARLDIEVMALASARFVARFHFVEVRSGGHILATPSHNHHFRIYTVPLERPSASSKPTARARKCDECGAPREGGETHCRYCKSIVAG